MSTTDDSQTSPPDGRQLMEEYDWSEQEETAFEVLHQARPGDYVLWADRSVGMEVTDRYTADDGHAVLVVDQPRGDGTYEVHENYQGGKPKYTSEIGRANNLHWVERQPEPRRLDEQDYAVLVESLEENATDTFMRLDYQDWENAVEDVVSDWSEGVALRDWRGYKHHPDWQDGDPEAIFESIVDMNEETLAADTDDMTIREQAELALIQDVARGGRRQAEASLITSGSDYYDLVQRLAHHSIDRYDRKSYPDARVAVRDTISNWIDNRDEVVYEAIIEYGNDRFDTDHYSGERPIDREMAFDILDHDVWEQAQSYQRDRGEHDPTVRGLTYTNYRDLVDALVETTIRNYRGSGFLRTAAKDAVEEWAEEVENEEWDGHRHRVYVEGDVEDIFASAAIHATADPFVWNPMADDRERRMAEQALVADVVDATEDTLDEGQSSFINTPVEEYLDDHLGIDEVNYADLASAHPEEVVNVAERIIESVDGDEVGWTFVDEILEHGGRVPEMTNDWVLIDYGVVRQGEALRSLAWFDRDTGNVLVLSGMAASDDPMELADLEEPYEQFHVTHHAFGDDDPDYLLTDTSLDEAMNYIFDYMDAEDADFTVIENGDEVWVADAMSDEDLNVGGVMDALVPNIPWQTEDVLTFADAKLRKAGSTLDVWGPQLAKLASYVVLWQTPKWLGDRLDGIRIEPNIHKDHGVGVEISKQFGSDNNVAGIGGAGQVEINVRPQTFASLSERLAPRFVKYGFREGDFGTGALKRSQEAVKDIQHADEDDALSKRWGKEFLDTFGGSITSLLFTFADPEDANAELQQEIAQMEEEERQHLDRELKREFIAEQKGKPESDVNVESEWDDLSGERKEMFGAVIEDAAEQLSGDDVRWDGLHDESLGLSALMMRGLDAESVVGAAEFLNVDDWLKGKTTTLYPSDYVNEDPPSFEEWEEERFGPGAPGGPEEEERRLARFHRQASNVASEVADPFTEIGVSEETREEIDEQPDLGDYDIDQYESGFGNQFDEVAEKFRANEQPLSEDSQQEGHE